MNFLLLFIYAIYEKTSFQNQRGTTTSRKSRQALGKWRETNILSNTPSILLEGILFLKRLYTSLPKGTIRQTCFMWRCFLTLKPFSGLSGKWWFLRKFWVNSCKFHPQAYGLISDWTSCEEIRIIETFTIWEDWRHSKQSSECWKAQSWLFQVSKLFSPFLVET